jgi:O-antigen ligase
MHANELGRLYAIAYALLLFSFAGATHPGLRGLLLATMGAVVIALALTFSRGAFLGFFLVNLFFILWNRGTGALLLLAVAAALALLAVPDAVFERILAGHDRGANAISAGRIDSIWIPLLPELLANPVFGSGLGSMMWSEAIRRGAGFTILLVTHPHNAYLQALLDMGLAGLAALCAYFFHVWRRFRALASSPSTTPLMRGFWRGASVGLICFLVSGITDSSLTPVSEQSFLWFAIGLMYGQSREARAP